MKKYCITELCDVYVQRFEQVGYEGIHFQPELMMLLRMSWMEYDFVECSNDIDILIRDAIKHRKFCNTEVEMYRDIMMSAIDSIYVDFDIYMHLNFSARYKKSEGKYVALVKDEWNKDEVREIKTKRKNLKSYIQNNELIKMPFVIDEKDNKKTTDKGKIYYEHTQIRDCVADVVRLYYLSHEFRRLLDLKDNSASKKYYYEEIKRKLKVEAVTIKRHEDIWFLERLLGLNTALSFYSFFQVVFQNLTIKDIESRYSEIMDKIIGIIMNWEGVYSRTIFIHKMKVLWEISKRTKKNVGKNDSIKEFLEYIYAQVLCVVIPTQVRQYKVYSHRVMQENNNDYAVKMEKWKKYFDECIEEKNGYYFTKQNVQTVENERLYSMIQKIVITKCMK